MDGRSGGVFNHEMLDNGKQIVEGEGFGYKAVDFALRCPLRITSIGGEGNQDGIGVLFFNGFEQV